MTKKKRIRKQANDEKNTNKKKQDKNDKNMKVK